MSFEYLVDQIESLSAQVETLLFEETEEQCSTLLAKRLELLNQLAVVVENDDSKQSSYHDFLASIQARDAKAVELIKVKKQEINSANSQQKSRNKALNVYHKFSE